jgi:hypothetical protein
LPGAVPIRNLKSSARSADLPGLVNHILDFTAGDEDRLELHGHTPVPGIWVKPRPNLCFHDNDAIFGLRWSF